MVVVKCVSQKLVVVEVEDGQRMGLLYGSQ